MRFCILHEVCPLVILFGFEHQSRGYIILKLLTKKNFSITGNPVKILREEKKN